MSFLISLADILSDIPWAQFGLAGVTFATLSMLFWRVIKKYEGTIDMQFVVESRKELLEEIEKREARFVELQEKTLEVISKNSIAIEKLADRLTILENKNDK